MGKLLERLKKDEEFRTKAIMATIVGLFLLNFQQSAQTQATVDQCASYNPIAGILGKKENWNVCDSQCTISWSSKGQTANSNSDAQCSLQAVNGRYIKANTMTQARDKCESGFPVEIQNFLIGPTVYRCDVAPEGHDVGFCKSWQKPFAKVTNSILKPDDMDCSTAAYMAVGAIGTIALVAI